MTVAVVGLGYVGLPLAIEFGKKRRTIGFDLSQSKIAAYRTGIDPSGEIDAADFASANQLSFHTDSAPLKSADFVVIAVPTPVDEAHNPDFSYLISSSQIVGKNLKRGAIVVYESTVYPGATEEICVPELERASGLTWKKDFHVGYSPERINPGDKNRTLTKIVKVVAGDDAATLDKVAETYGAIITAGIYRAKSVKVAEAAKVIENTQRDINIALMNELSIMFDKIGIDTMDVLEAAGTKWNFMPFRPGLVGGHCIGVDPYYLTYKAETLGYHPQMILAGRRINDGMSSFVAQQTVKQLIRVGSAIRGAKIVVFGVTFKENCADLRNSKVAELVRELQEFGCEVSVHDPRAMSDEAENEYNIKLTSWDDLPKNAEAVVLAVTHSEYLEQPAASLLACLKPGGVVIDIKSALMETDLKALGAHWWRL